MSGYGMRFVVRLRMAAYRIAPCSDSCGKQVQNRMAEVGESVNMTSELVFPFTQTTMSNSKISTGKTEQLIELIRGASPPL